MRTGGWDKELLRILKLLPGVALSRLQDRSSRFLEEARYFYPSIRPGDRGVHVTYRLGIVHSGGFVRTRWRTEVAK